MTPDRSERRTTVIAHGLLALLTFVPLLRTAPGRVAADTKSYLYLSPERVLRRASSMWDPNVGMGTLTHQNIGYLFPMGPWYWLFERIGAPDWVAQRLWLATILFAAGAGLLFLARTLHWRGWGPVVAAIAYALGPYVLHYAARISVILLPWAALPWLVALVARALRRGGWRHPALFALVVLAVSGVNATAVVYAGVGPVLWLPFAVWVSREATLRRALATAARVGVLTAGVCLWWAAGLAVQGSYGLPILEYTETVATVSRTSLASEVLRGLGYWFFYGNDALGPWIEPSVDYTQRTWLILAGFAVPVLAFAGAAVLRWRHRAYAVCLVAVGTLIAVGAHPYDRPSPVGAAFKALADGSTVGLALRSTPRAVPLVSLGIVLLLGGSVTAVARRLRTAGAVAAVLVVGLVLAGLPSLFNGELAVGEHLQRPEAIPTYWQEAASALDAAGPSTRVLELPGTDFSSYRWGNTVDPITPYLMDRPYVARELIPYGTPGSADLLIAFDRRLQEGVFEPGSVAPIARLMRAGTVVLRDDLLAERYRTPPARVLWDAFTPTPPGLEDARGFGPPSATRPSPGAAGALDERALGVPPSVPDPPAVATFDVDGVPTIVSTASTGGLLVAGDGEGLVDLAAAGLLPSSRPVRYAGSLVAPREWDDAVAEADAFVLTDSNRLRSRRWDSVRENSGFTEQAHVDPLLPTASDGRLDLFPGQDDDDHTVVEQRGVASVRATRYGNPVSFTPEDRAANAVDGDPSTAWRVGAFSKVAGERLRLDLAAPVTTSSVRLVQPLVGPRNRSITTARLRFDGSDDGTVDVALGPESLTEAGQTVSFPERTFRSIEFEVGDTTFGTRPRYDGQSGVGLAELDVAGARVEEVVRVPDRLLRETAARAPDKPLAVVLSRLRSSPADPARRDEEPTMKRVVTLPAGRTFALRGTARISALIPDEVIDDLLGAPGAAAGGLTARSDSRLPGDLRSRAAAAVDGDDGTAWQPGLLAQAGHWLEVESPADVDVDRLDLRVVADGRHSVPTSLLLEVDGAAPQRIAVPAVPDAATPGAVVAVPLPVEPVRGRRFRLTVDAVRPVTTRDFFSGDPLELPVAIAEVGLPGIVASQDPARELPARCRDDLLTVDGRPFPVRVSGTVGAALAREGLPVEACGVAPALDLGPGDHELRTAASPVAGLELDRIVLESPGGGVAAAVAPGVASAGPPPIARATADGRTAFDVRVEAPAGGAPFWLVLGQSHSTGWHATLEGEDLGPPVLVDGFANGWRIDGRSGPLDVRLEWTPQRTVRAGLAASALTALACLVIVAFGSVRARRRRQSLDGPGPDVDSEPELAGVDDRRVRPVVPVAVAVVATLAAGPAVGLAAALVAVAAAVVRPARWVLAFGAAASTAAAGAYVVVQQARYRYPPDFAWPVNFPLAHHLGWLAVVLLAATMRRWQDPRRTDRSEESLKPASASQQNRNESARVPDAL